MLKLSLGSASAPWQEGPLLGRVGSAGHTLNPDHRRPASSFTAQQASLVRAVALNRAD
jgi:hypothetical protein